MLIQVNSKGGSASVRAPRKSSFSGVAATRSSEQAVRAVAYPQPLRPAYAPPVRRDLPTTHGKRLTPARARSLNHRKLLQGEQGVIGAVITFWGFACVLGSLYLAAYARVDEQARQVHALQQDVAVAQARHEVLVQELASLESASRISVLAGHMHMVHGGPSEYVVAGAPASAFSDSPAGSAQVASTQ